MAKTIKCIINDCNGVMTIKNTKPTKANGIVKLYAICTSCGNHPMSSKRGQSILRLAIEQDDVPLGVSSEYIEEINKEESDEVKNVSVDKENNQSDVILEKTSKNNTFNRVGMVVMGFCAFFGGLTFLKNKKRIKNTEKLRKWERGYGG